MINRADILDKTLYGTGVYGLILREKFPEDKVVMNVVGRDCGNCRNPFDNGNPTLHIWRERLHPEEKLSDELSYHHDLSGTIPDGDCFDFAERYYGLQGQGLLELLNDKLYLHLGEEFNQYTHQQETEEEELPLPTFSFFRKPIRNTVPLKTVTPADIYNYVTGTDAKEQTEHLRSIADKNEARAYKANNFDYVTFSGEFSKRNDANLIKTSNLLCVDIDHIDDVEGAFSALLKDRYFSTVLLFRSPSGDGLKWVIPIEYGNFSHAQVFDAVANYLRVTYNIRIDQSCRDISRACFLPYDEQAYINPNLM